MDSPGSLPQAEVMMIIETMSQIQKPIYATLMATTMTGSMLTPCFIALFYFSTRAQRRSPIFVFVMLGVAWSLGQCILSLYLLLGSLIRPFNIPNGHLVASIPVLSVVPTYLVDIALLFRVVAVFPRVTTSRRMLVAILGLPILLKFARLIEWIIWLIESTRHDTIVIQGYVQSELQRKCTIARWIFTLIDNGYITAVFLWKIRFSFSMEDSSRSSMGQQSSLPVANMLRRRIRTLFWFALSNFIIPVPIFVTMVVLVITAPDSLAFSMVSICASFISIICAVFATVWRGVSRHETSSGEVTFNYSGPPQFRSPDLSGRLNSISGAGNIRRRHGREEVELGMTMDSLRRESLDDDDLSADHRLGPSKLSPSDATGSPVRLKPPPDWTRSAP